MQPDLNDIPDRRPGESVNALRAYVDYRNMGTSRSLDKLLELYAKRLADNPQTRVPTMKRSTLATWSFRHDWQTRVKEWDSNLIASDTAAVVISATSVIQDEMTDYINQREQWLAVVARIPAFLESTEVIDEQVLDDGSKVSRQVVTVQMNTLDLYRLAKIRDILSQQARRALGLPEKITKQDFDGTIDVNPDLDSAKEQLAHLITNHLKRGGSSNIPQ